MAKRPADSVAITRGRTNVFADLGYPDAAERQAKLRLAHALNQVLTQQGLTQTAAAQLLGLTQPKVSALRHYKLAGFSVERLMTLLTVLDRDVEIVIRKKPRSRSVARISVVAARIHNARRCTPGRFSGSYVAWRRARTARRTRPQVPAHWQPAGVS